MDVQQVESRLGFGYGATCYGRRHGSVPASVRQQHTLVPNTTHTPDPALQTRLREVEERLAQAAAELELLRGQRGAMERRLLGAKTKEEVDELVRRLDAAETLAAEKHTDYANLQYRSQVSDQIQMHRSYVSPEPGGVTVLEHAGVI